MDSLSINLGVSKGISRRDLQPAPALGVQHGGDDLYGAAAVVQALAHHAGLGTVCQEAAEEQLDVGVVLQRVRVLRVYEGSHFRYAWERD